MPSRAKGKSTKTSVPKKKPSKVDKKPKPDSAQNSASKVAKMSEVAKPVYTYWLMKSEPESRMENGVDVKFGLEDLKTSKNQTACWDGVRNYEARNFMRSMRVGQQSFFYHSNCKNPGIAGLMSIVKEAYVDHTQFDKGDPHYDPKSNREDPRWSMVDVKYTRDLKRFVSLAELKTLHLEHKKSGRGVLANLSLFTRSRLSIQPLSEEEFQFILNLENAEEQA